MAQETIQIVHEPFSVGRWSAHRRFGGAAPGRGECEGAAKSSIVCDRFLQSNCCESR